MTDLVLEHYVDTGDTRWVPSASARAPRGPLCWRRHHHERGVLIAVILSLLLFLLLCTVFHTICLCRLHELFLAVAARGEVLL